MCEKHSIVFILTLSPVVISVCGSYLPEIKGSEANLLLISRREDLLPLSVRDDEFSEYPGLSLLELDKKKSGMRITNSVSGTYHLNIY